MTELSYMHNLSAKCENCGFMPTQNQKLIWHKRQMLCKGCVGEHQKIEIARNSRNDEYRKAYRKSLRLPEE